MVLIQIRSIAAIAVLVAAVRARCSTLVGFAMDVNVCRGGY